MPITALNLPLNEPLTHCTRMKNSINLEIREILIDAHTGKIGSSMAKKIDCLFSHVPFKGPDN
jgi:hypothetical protein